MAGTVVQSHAAHGNIGVITLTCTGDASDGSFPSTALSAKPEGRLLALSTNPGATAPTDNYDVALTDAEGFDVLGGKGANRDSSTTERQPLSHVVDESDTLTLAITGSSVNSAIIVIKLYYAKGGAAPGTNPVSAGAGDVADVASLLARTPTRLVFHGVLAGNTSAEQMPSKAGILARISGAPTNTGRVYIGLTGVTVPGAIDATTAGKPLAADQEAWFFLSANLSELFFICDAATDDVIYEVFAA